jgi:hypothetical protein
VLTIFATKQASAHGGFETLPAYRWDLLMPIRSGESSEMIRWS